MKLRLFVLYSLFFISFLASAQVRVTGRITDLQQKPVGDVIVKLMMGNRTLAFTSTNAKGEYVLKLKEAPKNEVMLLFNHISLGGRTETAAGCGCGEEWSHQLHGQAHLAVQHRGTGPAGRQVQPRHEKYPCRLCDGRGDCAEPSQSQGGEGCAQQRGVDEYQTEQEGEV